MGSFTLTSTQL